MILRYIPYVQTNFVLGLDSDEGPEPFELTKKFIDLAPGRLPGLLAALGLRPGGADEPGLPARRPRAAVPVPLPEQQPRDERPAEELHLAGVLRPAGGPDQLLVLLAGHRAGGSAATPTAIPQWMNVVRAMSSEGWGRIAYHTTIRRLLDTDPSVRGFMEGEDDRLPAFYAGADPAGPRPRCTRTCRRAPSCTTPTRT